MIYLKEILKIIMKIFKNNFERKVDTILQRGEKYVKLYLIKNYS
jgi:hypothetical protein